MDDRASEPAIATPGGWAVTRANVWYEMCVSDRDHRDLRLVQIFHCGRFVFIFTGYLIARPS